MLRLEDLLEIKDNHLAIELMLKGKFDEEINKLKQLKQEMEAMVEKVSTVKKMKEFIKAAEDEAASIKTDANEYYAKAEIYEENLKTRIEDFESKVSLHEIAVNEFVTLKNSVEAEIEKGKKFIEDKSSMLSDLEKSLDQKRIDLATWEEKIAAREKKLMDQIAAFKKV